MSNSDINHKIQVKEAKTQRLKKLELMKARHGIDFPPQYDVEYEMIVEEIYDLEREIDRYYSNNKRRKRRSKKWWLKIWDICLEILDENRRDILIFGSAIAANNFFIVVTCIGDPGIAFVLGLLGFPLMLIVIFATNYL